MPFYYIILTVVLIYIGHTIESFLLRNRRKKVEALQRDLYFQKLTANKIVMEHKEIKDIEQLQQDKEELVSRLNCEEDSDEDDGHDKREDDGDWSGSIDDKISIYSEELNQIQEQAKELQSVEKDVKSVAAEISKIDEFFEENASAEQIIDETKQLRQENEELNQQLKSYSNLSLAKKETELDPEVLKYLEDHRETLTLEFLERAHEALIRLKAINPDKDFAQYIDELKSSQANFEIQLEQLRVNREEAEMKYRILKEEYEKELSSLNDSLVDHIFENSSAGKHLERLKERNRIKEKLIIDLQETLDSKSRALDEAKQRYEWALQQCDKYSHAYNTMKIEKAKLEAQVRAKERGNVVNESMNLSSASSLMNENMVPRLLLNIPPIEELLKGD